MRGASHSRRRLRRRGFAELYAGLTIVAITFALSFLVYSEVHVSVRSQPVYSFESYSVYGTTSFLHLSINASGPTALSQFRVDGASSSSGILELTSSGYQIAETLCSSGATSFFSVDSPSGILTVGSSGPVWIDGTESASAHVAAGWHEIVVSDSSSCQVTLPGGEQVSYPSQAVSSMPVVQEGPGSFDSMIPFVTSGHLITAVFDGAIETYAF